MRKTILEQRFFNYNIFNDELDLVLKGETFDKPITINTLNPHSFYVADHDNNFREALEASQILLADGIGIVLANLLINGTKLQKISGMNVFLFLLKKLDAAETSSMKRVFFLGASHKTLSIIKKKIAQQFPSLSVEVYSPPFKTTFSQEEVNLMAQKVNAFRPYVLFVGMTAPKQEKWSHANKSCLKADIICSIGAVFDFYSENIKRPGKAWQMLGLEWLGRFIQEPKRLWKRSVISLPYFLCRVFSEAFRKRIG